MEIYLDESGDMGFDFEASQPSRYFVITLLVCENLSASQMIQRAVRNTLKNKLNIKRKNEHQELKASKLSSSIKHYFYQQVIKGSDWRVCAVVFDKLTLFATYQNKLPSKHRIYNHFSREALKLIDFSGVVSVKMVVDRSKNREEIKQFNKIIVTHLESRLPLSVPLKILHEKSHQDLGLQAVDLFSWGIFRHYETNDSEWRDYALKKTREVVMKHFIEEIGP